MHNTFVGKLFISGLLAFCSANNAICHVLQVEHSNFIVIKVQFFQGRLHHLLAKRS